MLIGPIDLHYGEIMSKYCKIIKPTWCVEDTGSHKKIIKLLYYNDT